MYYIELKENKILNISNIKPQGDYIECSYENLEAKIEELGYYVAPLTLEDEKNELRQRREVECFRVINRGSLWEETLTEEQKNELRVWYHLWLDVTETMVAPESPAWLA